MSLRLIYQLRIETGLNSRSAKSGIRSNNWSAEEDASAGRILDYPSKSITHRDP